MVKSMTGYGRAREMRSGRDITVEVRSVNNRYLDCTVKLPRAYIFAEDAIKTRVQKAISRGKVDVFVTIDTSAADVAVVQVNEGLAKGYYDALMHLKNSFALPGDVTPEVLARFPDVLTVTKAEEDVEAIAADICTVLDDALAAYNAMRAVEGEKLRTDVLNRLAAVETLVAQIEQNSAGRVQAYTERLYTRLKELLEDRNIDDARIVTEAAIFADKTAIDEETVRLHSHVAQYRSILELDEPVGRKLDFLTQELNRESNTIGSKCQDINITRLVVELKSEIEKIREQIQNIE